MKRKQSESSSSLSSKKSTSFYNYPAPIQTHVELPPLKSTQFSTRPTPPLKFV